MGFNCAQEKAKFDREWLRLRKEYTDAGMSEAAIQKIYEYDWYCFCRNRAYERRATQMPPLEIDSPDDARRSALFRKNETLSVSFDESAFPDRYAWVDTLEDARLLRAIMKLNGAVKIYAQIYLQAPADLKSAGNRGVVHGRL